MFQPGWSLAFQFRNDALGEHFAQLDAPLVERINIPNHALRENAVLVKRDERAEHLRRQALRQDRVRRTVALKNAVRHKPVRRALGFDFIGRLAKSQRLGLGKDIRQEDIMMASQRRERVGKRQKVARDKPRALMDQLIKGMLAIGAGFAPIDRAGLIIHLLRRRA